MLQLQSAMYEGVRRQFSLTHRGYDK